MSAGWIAGAAIGAAAVAQPVAPTPAAAPGTASPAGVPAGGPATQAPVESRVPLAGRELRRLLSDRSGEVQVQAIGGLRALRDPELTPLFSALARGARPALRGPSVLALADLSPGTGLDLLLVRSLDKPTQWSVIGQAVDDGKLPVEQLRDLTRWAELPERLHLAILARLGAKGERVESGRLSEIVRGSDRLAAACAALMRAQAGEEQPVQAPLERLLNEAGTSAGQRDLQGAMQFIRTARLASAGPFVRRVLERYPDDRLLTHEAVATLLMVDEGAARLGDWWQVQFSRAADEGDRQRLALAALAAAAVRPQAIAASITERLREDTSGMMRVAGDVLVALKAPAGGEADATLLDAMTRLVAFAQGATLAWAIEWAHDRPGEPGRSVLAAIVDQLASSPNDATAVAVVRAAARLAEEDPARLAPALRAAVKADDASAAERILLGVLRGGGGVAATGTLVDLAALTGDPGATWPGATSEHLADVVRARATVGAGEPDQAAAAALERIAAGAGQLGPGPRAQAGWLSMRLAGEGRAGLTRLMADLAG